ncbi:MAG: phosphonate C-P lyase system protein PhnH [Candidatus Flexifilum sp.]|jgi:alpha-D-ribose 1-methylphosphonate 5-triphosphate synthase subunit PhnH
MLDEIVTHPEYTPSERRMRETFLALMNAFAYPGRQFVLPDLGDPFALIAETLLDLETSAFTPHETLRGMLAATGARLLPPETAAYHFYAAADRAALDAIAVASTGELAHPDTAATLIIGGCSFADGDRWTLSGPGIRGTAAIRLGGLPADLWALRASRSRYPLGWDIYLLSGRTVIGLPRSTVIAEG